MHLQIFRISIFLVLVFYPVILKSIIDQFWNMDKNNCLLIYIFSDFRVLEARNRLGGRVATMQIGKKIALMRFGPGVYIVHFDYSRSIFSPVHT